MDNPLAKRFREFIQTPGHARTVSALVILIIAAAVPLTVLVAQQRQNTQQNAAGSTLSCSDSSGHTWTCPYYSCSGTCTETFHACGTYTNKCPATASQPSSLCNKCPSTSYNGGTCPQSCNSSGTCVISNYSACTTTTSPSPSSAATPTPTPGTIGGATPTPIGSTTNTCKTGTTRCNDGGTGYCLATYYQLCNSSGQWSDQYCPSGEYGFATGTSGGCVGSCTSHGSDTCGTSCATTDPNATQYTHPNYYCAPGTVCCAGTQPTSPPNTSPTPTPAPSLPTNLQVFPYCGNTPQTAYVSFARFSWTNPTTATPINLTYQAVDGKHPFNLGTNTSSFIAPQAAGTDAWGYKFTQCPTTNPDGTASNQGSSGYACGFTPNQTVTWTVNGVQGRSFVPLTCPQNSPSPSPTPNITCGTISYSPSSVNLNGTANVSISCSSNATSYQWTSNTCGQFNSNGSSSTTWTAPGSISSNPPQCPVSVKVCDSSGTNCVTSTANISVIPVCNGSSGGVGAPDCNGIVCVQNSANVCGSNAGTQQCNYDTYDVSNPNCSPVNNVPHPCDVNTCSNGNACLNNSCTGASPSPSPSGSPSPTPTPAPGDTVLAFNIGMDGVGSTGDNENPASQPNWQNIPIANEYKTPTITVSISDNNNNLIAIPNNSTTLNYDSNSGRFTGTLDLGQNFASGTYNVKVTSLGHLTRLEPGIQNLGPNFQQPIQLPAINLIAGDIDSNNVIDIKDYNIFASCSIFASSGISFSPNTPFDNGALCNQKPNYKIYSDLNEDGKIDQIDLNLFLREYSAQNGD